MITEFELFEKFQPFYKAGKQICITSDRFIIADDGENINYVNSKNFKKIDNLNKRHEVTCFAANENDYTVILADKNLMLTKIDRFNKDQRHKTWNSLHTAPIFTMCLNKLSTRLTTGSADNKVRIWHLGQSEGNCYSCIHHKSKINIVKNHPTDNIVFSSSILDYEIVAWDTETGKKLGLFSGHQNLVTGIDFHDKSNHLITSSRDETIRVWDCKTFEKIFIIATMESVETCIVLEGFLNQPESDDYLIMAGGMNGIMRTFSPTKKAVIQEFKKASLFGNKSQSAGADGENNRSELITIRLILNTDDSIVVVRESDNIEFYSKEMKLQFELAGDLSPLTDVLTIGKHRDILLAVESAPHMRLFECRSFFQNDQSEKAESDSKLAQWPCQLISGAHSKDITSVMAFSDGLKVVSGGKDGRVCVWGLDTTNQLKLSLITDLRAKENMVGTVCVDNSGELIYVHYTVDDTLAVLKFHDNVLTKLCSFLKPHGISISSMDVNITDSLFVTGSKDKTAKLWTYKPKTNEIISKGVFKGHKRGLWSVKFSKLEQILLTASMDKTVKLWSIEDFSCLSTFQSDYVIYKAEFYNNEKQIITCNERGIVNIWNREKGTTVKSIQADDQSTTCLNLLENEDTKVKGFVTVGGESTICLYRDVSETHIQISKEAHEAEIQNKQELDNLMQTHQYSRALHLAIKLDKPLAAFKILSKIQESGTEEVHQTTPLAISTDTELGTTVSNLTRDEQEKLFRFAVKWNTNAKTFKIGQLVAGVIMYTVPNNELLGWPVFVQNIEALFAYSSRHYERVKHETDRATFFDYLDAVVHSYKIIDLTMDTS